MFSGDRECVVLGMGRIERDLSGREHCLDRCGTRRTIGYQLTRGNELGSISCVPDRSEIDRAFQVSEDADGFGLVTLSRRGVVRTSHDDCELDLEAKFEEPDEGTNASLVSDGVDWCRVVGNVKKVHSVGRALFGKGRSTEGGQDFED